MSKPVTAPPHRRHVAKTPRQGTVETAFIQGGRRLRRLQAQQCCSSSRRLPARRGPYSGNGSRI